MVSLGRMRLIFLNKEKKKSASTGKGDSEVFRYQAPQLH